jgi:hypothetical protein
LPAGTPAYVLKHKLPVRKCQADTRVVIDMGFSMITADGMKAFDRHCGHSIALSTWTEQH